MGKRCFIRGWVGLRTSKPWPQGFAGLKKSVGEKLREIVDALRGVLVAIAKSLRATSWSIGVSFPWGVSVSLSW
jgi:hypothetical protein